jgi:hypothetical protein
VQMARALINTCLQHRPAVSNGHVMGCGTTMFQTHLSSRFIPIPVHHRGGRLATGSSLAKNGALLPT